MKKVIIFGFPHCGTTILRSIISHIDEVYEIVDESSNISDTLITEIKDKNPDKTYKYVLCKNPFVHPMYFKKDYDDYIKIFIIRNPLWVYSSLNKRFNYKQIDNSHSINRYIGICKLFTEHLDKSINNLYFIKYEDIFTDNYTLLKKIFDSIGFNYTDNIFNNTEYYNKVQSGKNLKLTNVIPNNNQHNLFRLYQINQPFINNNDMSKISLTKEQIDILMNDIDIQKIYPDIKDIVTNNNIVPI